MRVAAVLSAALSATALVRATTLTAQLYIQPIHFTDRSPALDLDLDADSHYDADADADADANADYDLAAPRPLAEIAYDPSDPSSASVTAWEAPDLPPSAQAFRVGLFDPPTARWVSGTTVASAANLGKGYAAHLVLSVDAAGRVLGAACRGVRIDAGATRDFGPQAVVVVEGRGARPELGRAVVMPEGRVGEQPEKTFLQKYWWMIGIAVLLAMTGGGGEK